MLYRTCSNCKKKLGLKEQCSCRKERNKLYDKRFRNQDSKRFYNSKDWLLIRNIVMNKFNYIDLYELNTTGKIIKADIIHHIIPLEESKANALNINNLIPVSNSNHNRIHKIYDKGPKEKKELQKKLKNFCRRGIGGVVKKVF